MSTDGGGDKECECGGLMSWHDMDKPPEKLGRVILSYVSDGYRGYFCLRREDGAFIGCDRAEPEDANLGRDLRWVVGLANENQELKEQVEKLRYRLNECLDRS